MCNNIKITVSSEPKTVPTIVAINTSFCPFERAGGFGKESVCKNSNNPM